MGSNLDIPQNIEMGDISKGVASTLARQPEKLKKYLLVDRGANHWGLHSPHIQIFYFTWLTFKRTVLLNFRKK
jgi:hypothetical protein